METAGEAFWAVGRLGGGLQLNFGEFCEAMHMVQGLALGRIVAANPPDALFDDAERAALAAIERTVERATAMATDEADLMGIAIFRKVARMIVIQASPARTNAPDSANWFWGRPGPR